jgi:4-alpha-glucanotransferase
MQDLLSLDSTSRMNSPGTTAGNWRWRFAWEQVDAALPAVLRARAAASGRLPAARPRA